MSSENTYHAACDTLITAVLVLTQDAERRVLTDAAIAVTDGRITAIGPQDALARITARERIELPHSLVMPGLVNAHTHAAMTLLRGLADDLPLMEWLTGHIWPREKHLSSELVELGTLLGCAEMIRTGTTAFMDMYIMEDAVCRAVDTSGVRALLGEGIFGFASAACDTATAAMDKVRELVSQYSGYERLRFGVMPHTVYTTNRQILADSLAFAQELDLPLHMHLAETHSEIEQSLAMYGVRPAELCRELGLLGPKSTFAHCVMLNRDEVALLSETGSKVVHCPKSNMKLASGVAPLPDMLASGVIAGLGTDGAASNNSLNMFSEMSCCALLHKIHQMQPTAAPAQAVLDMATLGGAAALNWPGLGCLEEGGPADCIALDLNSPNMQPLFNPASQLVYAASGHEVHMTMVAGKVLYRDGKYASIDYPALMEAVREARTWALSLG